MPITNIYPALRTQIEEQLSIASELEKFVRTPTPLAHTYGEELMLHYRAFAHLVKLTTTELEEMLVDLLAKEAEIEPDFQKSQRNPHVQGKSNWRI